MRRTQRIDTLQCATVRLHGSVAGTFLVSGPFFPEATRVVEAIYITVASATTVGTDTFTLQPWYSVKGTQYSIGAAVATTSAGIGSIPALTPTRCHQQERLDFRLPQGAMIGVTLARSAGTLSSPTLLFLTYGG